jgi:dTDP-4-dehydrorhamnose 3,5-epimerase
MGDARGFSSEVSNARAFAATGINAAFVQDNHVCTPLLAGTLRGLHYQVPPSAQGKLVRVTRVRSLMLPSISVADRQPLAIMHIQF